ncbi:MAG: hypothetical protein HY514_01140 [Candidatus Aenigmarchaeota archaeon]|nr:hypothetical protein [Candidatus Aenigmarchaeota archaeon]
MNNAGVLLLPDIKTTQFYTHVSTATIKNVRSPLDTLDITPQEAPKSEQKQA